MARRSATFTRYALYNVLAEWLDRAVQAALYSNTFDGTEGALLAAANQHPGPSGDVLRTAPRCELPAQRHNLSLHR